jgi:hypothetical protein
MLIYSHRQVGTLILIALLIPLAFSVWLGLGMPGPLVGVRLITLLAGALLAVCAWLFSSLTVEITETELRWHFGSGLIRSRVALADIESCTLTRTRLIEGWGIHLTSRGWLYNVSGWRAVHIRLKTGRPFMLGTDEPEELIFALRDALADIRPNAPPPSNGSE